MTTAAAFVGPQLRTGLHEADFLQNCEQITIFETTSATALEAEAETAGEQQSQ